MKKYLLVPAFLVLSNLSYAQQAILKGRLKSADGQAAPYVSVGLKNSSKGTQSDANGAFELRGVAAGAQTLVITQVGVKSIETPFVAGNEGNVDLGSITLHEDALQLQEVNVNCVRNQNEQPVNIGKTYIRPMDLPQAVAVVDRSVMDQQQVQTVGDALKNVNGVYIMGNTGGYQQELAARGFAMSSSNTFKNGVRFNNGIMPQMTAVERVEVMKGSSAILFGSVAPGGVINLVTRKPGFVNGGTVGMKAESYSFYEPFVDVQGVSANGRAGFRMNTSYQNAQSFRQFVTSDRVYFNPSVAFKLTSKTDLIVEGDYLKDRRTPDFGVGAINYELIDVPRERFIGVRWSKYDVEQGSVTATLNHRISKTWQIRSLSSVQTFESDLFSNVRPNSNNQFIAADGKWIRGLQRTAVHEEYYITQLDLMGKFNTGMFGHNVLIGGDVDKYYTTTLAYNNVNRYDSVNVFNPGMYKERADIPEMSKRALTTAPTERAGFYVQDLVSITSRFKVLAGVRFSYLEVGSRVTTYKPYKEEKSNLYDFAATPRFGLVYQPTQKMSLFASYANAFNTNTGVDVNGKALQPSFIDQYEVGFKSNLFREVLSANVTAYQIVNSNLAQTSLANGNTNSNIKELAGEVTSRGVEVDVMSKSFFGFSLISGYAYNQTKYTKSNTYIEGSLLRYNPAHTANLSLYYTVGHGKVKGLSFGSGVQYVGERWAGRSTRVTVENDTYKLIRLAPYTLLDLNAAYSFRNLTLRLKLSNVLNSFGYNVHDDNSVNPIAPRQVAGTLAVKF